MYAAEISLQFTVKDDEQARQCPTCKGTTMPSVRLFTAVRDIWQERAYTAGLQPQHVDAESLGENLYVMNMSAIAPTKEAAEQFVMSLQSYMHHPKLQIVEDAHTGETRNMKLHITDPSYSGLTMDIYHKLLNQEAL